MSDPITSSSNRPLHPSVLTTPPVLGSHPSSTPVDHEPRDTFSTHLGQLNENITQAAIRSRGRNSWLAKANPKRDLKSVATDGRVGTVEDPYYAALHRRLDGYQGKVVFLAANGLPTHLFYRHADGTWEGFDPAGVKLANHISTPQNLLTHLVSTSPPGLGFTAYEMNTLGAPLDPIDRSDSERVMAIRLHDLLDADRLTRPIPPIIDHTTTSALIPDTSTPNVSQVLQEPETPARKNHPLPALPEAGDVLLPPHPKAGNDLLDTASNVLVQVLDEESSSAEKPVDSSALTSTVTLQPLHHSSDKPEKTKPTNSDSEHHG